MLPALAIAPAGAASTAPRVVVELFTSQSCSSCPPADALLQALVAERPEVLALSWHVTYWDRLGWRDRFSLAAATERQRRYAGTLGARTVYTPQVVIQGRRDAVGSDRAAVLAAIAGAAPPAAALTAGLQGNAVQITAGAGPGSGELLLVGFDPHHVTAIGGGENGGRTLSHSHVVRSLASLGPWQGRAMTVEAPRGPGERAAVLLQAPDGGILAMAVA
jgi:hypothetical protein